MVDECVGQVGVAYDGGRFDCNVSVGGHMANIMGILMDCKPDPVEAFHKRFEHADKLLSDELSDRENTSFERAFARDAWKAVKVYMKRKRADKWEDKLFPEQAVILLSRMSCCCQQNAVDVETNRHCPSCSVGQAQKYLGKKVTFSAS